MGRHRVGGVRQSQVDTVHAVGATLQKRGAVQDGRCSQGHRFVTFLL